VVSPPPPSPPATATATSSSNNTKNKKNNNERSLVGTANPQASSSKVITAHSKQLGAIQDKPDETNESMINNDCNNTNTMEEESNELSPPLQEEEDDLMFLVRTKEQTVEWLNTVYS
jgi:hypothetical protein